MYIFLKKVKKSAWLSDNIPLSAEPSGRPEQVTLSDVTSTSIKVTWTAVKVDDQNGIIKGYKVIYQALSDGKKDIVFLNISVEKQNAEQSLMLKELNEFTNYSIRVLAFTAVGDGPLSVAQFKQTLEAGKLYQFFFFTVSWVVLYSDELVRYRRLITNLLLNHNQK